MAQEIQRRKKRYVRVNADFDEDGSLTPRVIIWEDGRRFEIDRILDRRQAASLKVGGNGIRYLIRVGDSKAFLYYEGPRWFVEEKVGDLE